MKKKTDKQKTQQREQELPKNEQRSKSTSLRKNSLEELCKKSGIPFSRNQRQKGTASIRFIGKLKKD